MHVTVTRASTGDEPVANATIVGEEMHRWLSDVEGFVGFMVVSRQGTSLGLTFWASAEVAERNRATRDEFRDRMLGVAGVVVEEVVDYELTFAELPSLTFPS
jgi:hypothetical protein